MIDKIYKYIFVVLLFASVFVLTGCAHTKTGIQYNPVRYSQLPNWNSDNLIEVWPSFIRSCKRITTKHNRYLSADKKARWLEVCRVAFSLKNPSNAEIKNFFESYFTPYRVSVGGQTEGLFTGYYEPLLKGSYKKTKQYKAPIYKRPKDLVMYEDLGVYRKMLRGKRFAGRYVHGRLRPYFTHAEISRGAIRGNELLYIEDPVDAFFTQIQGSAAIKLKSGEVIHLIYAGTNGHAYTPIGRILIEEKGLQPEEISMQSIRAWLKKHPGEAQHLLNRNASFVFFNVVKGPGPYGDQGVVLTPGRSMAVDIRYVSYGTPLWLDVENPVSDRRIQRLVIAQDKGGAIKGVIRGDLFWGIGDQAGELAGLMRSRGSYYMLLPYLPRNGRVS